MDLDLLQYWKYCRLPPQYVYHYILFTLHSLLIYFLFSYTRNS